MAFRRLIYEPTQKRVCYEKNVFLQILRVYKKNFVYLRLIMPSPKGGVRCISN